MTGFPVAFKHGLPIPCGELLTNLSLKSSQIGVNALALVAGAHNRRVTHKLYPATAQKRALRQCHKLPCDLFCRPSGTERLR